MRALALAVLAALAVAPTQAHAADQQAYAAAMNYATPAISVASQRNGPAPGATVAARTNTALHMPRLLRMAHPRAFLGETIAQLPTRGP